MRSNLKKTGPNLNNEIKLWQQGYDFVVGLDEVGRGPLAGPVVAGAFCFCKKQKAPANFKFQISNFKFLQNIKDSKKLSVRHREEWYKFLTHHPDIKWGIGLVSEKIIDQINILAATKLAMKRALEALAEKGTHADYLLLDGNFLLEGLAINQKAVVRGDEKIWSCAAASIIAKVTRDRLMLKYHQKYPQYAFDRHKGYGTRQHVVAIKKHGPCELHRKSFAPCKKR